MKKILFTGFEPFGKENVNPSWEAVKLLPDVIEGAVIVKRQMPVEYDTVGLLLEQILKEEHPDVVICVGQAGGRAAVTPEMVAINWNEASIADNAGKLYQGEPICKDGPAAYFATIPVKEITSAMREAGVPASVSFTAGTYVCNHLMYRLLGLLESYAPQAKGGFIHVPFACSQTLDRPSSPSLPLALIAKGLEAAAVCCLSFV